MESQPTDIIIRLLYRFVTSVKWTPNCFNMILTILILFSSVSYSLCEFQKPVLSDQYFVNQLISEYFKAEQHLWTISESRSDKTLNEIYATNKYFLSTSLDISLRRSNYLYSPFFGLDHYMEWAREFNLRLDDPVSFPIRKDKPDDLFLSNNVTLQMLGEAEKMFNERNDLARWNETFNVCFSSLITGRHVKFWVKK